MGPLLSFSMFSVFSMWHPAPPKRNCFCSILQEALEFLCQYSLVRKSPLIILPRYETDFEKNPYSSRLWFYVKHAVHPSVPSLTYVKLKENHRTPNNIFMSFGRVQHWTSFGNTTVYLYQIISFDERNIPVTTKTKFPLFRVHSVLICW